MAQSGGLFPDCSRPLTQKLYKQEFDGQHPYYSVRIKGKDRKPSGNMIYLIPVTEQQIIIGEAVK